MRSPNQTLITWMHNRRIMSALNSNFDGRSLRIKLDSRKSRALRRYATQGGKLSHSVLTAELLGKIEDFPIFAAITNSGERLESELAMHLVMLPVISTSEIGAIESAQLASITSNIQKEIEKYLPERITQLFSDSLDKLDSWADGLKVKLESDIRAKDSEIKQAKRAATFAQTLEEKLACQKEVNNLENGRNEKRRELFDVQDEIDKQRGALIADIEDKSHQKLELEEIFTIEWELI